MPPRLNIAPLLLPTQDTFAQWFANIHLLQRLLAGGIARPALFPPHPLGGG